MNNMDHKKLLITGMKLSTCKIAANRNEMSFHGGFLIAGRHSAFKIKIIYT
jgi:hypothetical protein